MNLTAREKDVLSELIQGKANIQIANSLDISINTVRTHLSRMYNKTNTDGRSQLILKVLTKNN